MSDEFKNPYDKAKQESLYLSYEHGFNSMNKEIDNPYMDLPELAKENSAWLQGYAANTKRAKPKRKVEPNPLSKEEKLPIDGLLSDIDDNTLKAELARRAKRQHDEYIPEYNEAIKKLKVIEDKMNKLKLLMEL